MNKVDEANQKLNLGLEIQTPVRTSGTGMICVREEQAEALGSVTKRQSRLKLMIIREDT